MSQENVEIAKAGFTPWSLILWSVPVVLFAAAALELALAIGLVGDYSGRVPGQDVDAINVGGLEDWPEGPEVIVGREAVIRTWELMRQTWDADTAEPISFIDAGDRVVVRIVWRAVGHGPDLNMDVTYVGTARKGKVSYVEFFWDHTEALETLGLSE